MSDDHGTRHLLPNTEKKSLKLFLSVSKMVTERFHALNSS